MTHAIARFSDALSKLFVQPDAGMATQLLTGLNQNGLVEEAVALLGRLESIPLDTPMANAVLETLLLSSDAASCFSAFDVIKRAPVALSSETFTLLLLACEKTGEWSRVTSILTDMQKLRVRGSPHCLNLLLKGLLKAELQEYAEQLFVAMDRKGIPVWEVLQPHIPDNLKRINRSERPGKRGFSRRSDAPQRTKSLILSQKNVESLHRLSGFRDSPKDPEPVNPHNSRSNAEVYDLDEIINLDDITVADVNAATKDIETSPQFL
jgi:hypothetical protein